MDSAAKCLKDSDLVVIQPNNLFGDKLNVYYRDAWDLGIKRMVISDLDPIKHSIPLPKKKKPMMMHIWHLIYNNNKNINKENGYLWHKRSIYNNKKN